jgi:hypothetical protein
MLSRVAPSHSLPVSPTPAGAGRKSGFIDPIKEAKAVSALRGSLEQLGGEDAQLLLDMIEGETSFFEVVDRVLERIADSQALAFGLGVAISDFQVRKKRFEDRAKADKTLIEQALFIADLERIERPTATLFLARRAQSVEIAEEADIPAEFWKVGDPQLDKKALLAALKEGRAVPGACLSNGAPSLTVRTK